MQSSQPPASVKLPSGDNEIQLHLIDWLMTQQGTTASRFALHGCRFSTISGEPVCTHNQ